MEPGAQGDDEDEISPDLGDRYYIDARHSRAIQVGDGNVQNVYMAAPRTPVSLPHRVGTIPPLADCYQARVATSQLAAMAASGGTTVVRQILSGLGGVGKTQLAAAHAEQAWRRDEVDLLVWVSASSRQAVLDRYAEAVTDVTGIDDQDVDRAAGRFVSWLATTDKRWLLILDDLVQPDDLRGLWPPDAPNGSTVVTTRRRDHSISRRGHVVDLDVFTLEESHAYLEAKLVDHAHLADDLNGLVEDLGHLPLALAQAVTYMLDRDRPASWYRTRFADTRRRLERLVPEPGSLPDDHQATLAATWTLSVELADQLNPVGLSRPLLTLASLLDPAGIPESVLTTAAACDFLRGNRTIGDGTDVEPDDAHDGLRCLYRLSLLDFGSGAAGIRVHAMVQRATRDETSHDVLAVAAEAAADALMQAWPEVEVDTGLGQALRANTAALVGTTPVPLCTAATGCHPVLFRAGGSLGESGSVREANTYFRDLAGKCARGLGPDHVDTLSARASQASWLGKSGDFVGAVAAFTDLLADRTRVLGMDHPDTLTTRASLASYLGRSGDVAGAVAAFEELLADQLKVLCPDDPATLTTRARLASWRGRSGDVSGAAQVFEELLADWLRVRGPDHPDTLSTRASLATWRGRNGEITATTALMELLTDELRVYGPDHPDTLATRASLAGYLSRSGDYDAAVAAFQELLADRLRILGPNHPDTLATRHGLANARGRRGDAATATVAFEELLNDQIRVLGPMHPAVLRTRAAGAYWQGQSGNRARAVEAAADVLVQQLRLLGAGHPDTLATRDLLASWRGKPSRAKGLGAALETLLAAQLETLGPDHPETLTTRAAHASWQGRIGDHPGAAMAMRGVLADRLRVLGPDHVEVLRTRARFATLLEQAGYPAGAAFVEELLVKDHWRIYGQEDPGVLTVLERLVSFRRRARHVVGTHTALRWLATARKRILGPDDPETLRARADYAVWLGKIGNAAGAAKELRKILEARTRILGPDDADTISTWRDLAVCSRRAGDHEAATAALEEFLAAEQRVVGADHDDTRKTVATLAKWRSNPARRPAPVPWRPSSDYDIDEDGGPDIYTAAARRLSEQSPHLVPYFEALALAKGRGVPFEDRTWTAMAEALGEGEPTGEVHPDEIMAAGTPYVVSDWEDGQLVYRLAHPTVRNFFIHRVGRRLGIDAGSAASLRHGQIAAALLTCFTPNPYLVTRLVEHVADSNQWKLLARYPHVLDQLDPDAVVAEVLRAAFDVTKLPPEIDGLVRAWPFLVSIPPPDRTVVRGIAEVGLTVGESSPAGVWQLKWTSRPREPLHVPLTELSPARSRVHDNPDAMRAITEVKRPGKSTLLAVGDHTGIITLIDPLSASTVGKPIDHGGVVDAITTVQSLDGATLLVTAGEHAVRLWDPLTAQPVGEPLVGHEGVHAVTIVQKADGRTLLATAGDDGAIRLWDPFAGVPAGDPLYGHNGPIWDLCVVPTPTTEALLASAGEDGTVRFWNITNRRSVEEPLTSRHGPIYALAVFRVGGKSVRLITGGRDGVIRVWNPFTRKALGKPMKGHTSKIRSLATFEGADGRIRLASGGDDRTARLWNPYTSEQVGAPLTGHTARIQDITAIRVPAPTGHSRILLATCSHDASVRLWSLRSSRRRTSSARERMSAVSALTTLEFEAGQHVLAIGHDDGTVRLQDAETRKPFGQPLHGHTGQIHDITAASLPNGQTRLITGSDDQTVRFWDPLSGECLAQHTMPSKHGVRSMATVILNDGKHLVATGSNSGVVNLWDPSSCASAGQSLVGHHNAVSSMVFAQSDDGASRLITGSVDQTIRIWNLLQSEDAPGPLTDNCNAIYAMTLLRSSNGRLLLAAGGNENKGRIRLWDPFTGERVSDMAIGHGDSLTRTMTTISAPDGRNLLVTAGRNRTIRLWDIEARQQLHKLDIEGPIVGCHAFGSCLAIGAEHGVSVLALNDTAAQGNSDPR